MMLNKFALRFQAHPPSELHNMLYHFSIDIQSGFWHIPVHKEQFLISKEDPNRTIPKLREGCRALGREIATLAGERRG
jgi:hypothetical protein